MNYPRILVIASLLALAACQPKSADTDKVAAKDASPAAATVNGEVISNDLLDVYAKGLANKPASELTAEQHDRVLDTLVRAMLIAQQADKQGVTKEKETVGQLELARLNVLQRIVSERYLKDKRPSEQEVRAEYETQVAALPRLEYHARHILVATSQFAEKLIAELDKGADFTALAKRESMDQGAKQNGGDLGWQSPDRFPKQMGDAIAALKPGQFTHTPVKSEFGWHVIKVEDTRDVAAPPFDNVKQRLEGMVLEKKLKAYTDELLKTAKVEKKAAPVAAPAAGASGAAPAAAEPAKPTG